MTSPRASLAVYPGSFDPLTNGHLNIIERSLELFDRLVVAIAQNDKKVPLFTLDERVRFILDATGNDPRVEVAHFQGLLVDYARLRGARVVVRGLRAVSDFEYEFQMAHMNRRLHPEMETVFMMTGDEHFYVSSRLVKEVASLGGDVTGIVPPNVQSALLERFPNIQELG
jgi:pantetheine-phosphate adenylyltransferase